MIIDFRYHVASLVAIFIALALGILLGSSLVGQDILENMAGEQQLWIGKLEKDYLNLKKDTDFLRLELVQKQTQLQYYESFVTKIRPYLVEGRLIGKKFAIIELDQKNDSFDLANILEQSGAEITSSTRLSFTGEMILNSNLNLILEDAVNLILNGVRTEITDQMEDGAVLKTIGNYGDIVDGVIMVTGFEIKDKISLDTQNYIIDYLKDKLPLYLISDSEIFTDRGNSNLGVLNKIDTIPGQVSLIISILEDFDKNSLKPNYN